MKLKNFKRITYLIALETKVSLFSGLFTWILLQVYLHQNFLDNDEMWLSIT